MFVKNYKKKNSYILVTGSAGFIGMHLCLKFKSEGFSVVGIDNLNDYYDVSLKKKRHSILKKKNIKTYKIDLNDLKKLKKLFVKYKFNKIINLAAQAGVRYSFEKPQSYIDSNVTGFFNLIELSRINKIKHFVYASSSSVYGLNEAFPFKEQTVADHPIALYGATKRSNEILAHSYSAMYNLPTTGLRFFTVYGPWGRPDMALFKFTKKIIKESKIEVYNNGNMIRDFTYIDDIVEGIFRVALKIPTSQNKKFNFLKPDPSESYYPFKLFNIGNNKPIKLMKYIKEIEKQIGKKSKIKFLDMQKGDVKKTCASTDKLFDWVNYKPTTSIKQGIKKFINWYETYYEVKKK